eukprot:6212083-Pleurochrysis_carterae.AAC.1
MKSNFGASHKSFMKSNFKLWSVHVRHARAFALGHASMRACMRAVGCVVYLSGQTSLRASMYHRRGRSGSAEKGRG